MNHNEQSIHAAVEGMSAQLSAQLTGEPPAFSEDFEQRLLERISQPEAAHTPPSLHRVMRCAAAVLLMLMVLSPFGKALLLRPIAYQEGAIPSCLEEPIQQPFSQTYWLISHHEVDDGFRPVSVTVLPEGVVLTDQYQTTSIQICTYESADWLFQIRQERCDANGEYRPLDLNDANECSILKLNGEPYLEAVYDNHADIQYVEVYQEMECYLVSVSVSRSSKDVDGSSLDFLLETAYTVLEGCTLAAS